MEEEERNCNVAQIMEDPLVEAKALIMEEAFQDTAYIYTSMVIQLIFFIRNMDIPTSTNLIYQATIPSSLNLVLLGLICNKSLILVSLKRGMIRIMYI